PFNSWCPEAESNHRHEDFQSLPEPAHYTTFMHFSLFFIRLRKTPYTIKLYITQLGRQSVGNLYFNSCGDRLGNGRYILIRRWTRQLGSRSNFLRQKSPCSNFLLLNLILILRDVFVLQKQIKYF